MSAAARVCDEGIQLLARPWANSGHGISDPFGMAGGLPLIPFSALRHFAPTSRDFFIGQSNVGIGCLSRPFLLLLLPGC
jgi:hypothetical protein